MTNTESLVSVPSRRTIACHDCDLLVDAEVAAPAGSTICCPRCGSELFRVRRGNFERAHALTVTALILFVIANCFPVVGLNIQGHLIEVTLFGAAKRLWDSDMWLLAGLVAITTVLIPLLELLAIAWIVQPLMRGRRPAGFARLLRLMHLTHPWAMVEVFLLGVLVSLVKLAHLAQVIPGIGIWAYGAVMLLITAIAASYDQYSLWRAWEEAQP